jgi:hypothetical protein
VAEALERAAADGRGELDHAGLVTLLEAAARLTVHDAVNRSEPE